ncbi:hypothetical protein [Pararhizobium arenae]|uniref:hypothetical protein n=1 Tax=Pararhizobium arenae TaxID=1856850 RepID=UPI00094AB999|nr:hypothetical protein [Pararhizobium arenae]
MVPMEMPRYTSFRTLASGATGFYWICPMRYRKLGSPYKASPLGENLSVKELHAAAKLWNDRLDAWLVERRGGHEVDTSRYGSIEWLINTYLSHDSFLENVQEFSRPDYKRILDRVSDTKIRAEKSGLLVRIGDAKINQVSVRTAEKIYKEFADAPRSAEKVVSYCKTMWKRMIPHYPEMFRQDTKNPWEGVTVKKRVKNIKGYVDRATVYRFANAAIKEKRGELAAAAILAFEWLMRPTSIGAGYAAWTGYRGAAHPDKISVRHRKTGEPALHPLEFIDDDGQLVSLYPDAEKILKQVPRYGVSIVAQHNGNLFGDGGYLTQEVAALAAKVGMPGFTLDKARHGGMTELEELGLTEGEGRALSRHRTSRAYSGYAKETELRTLNATKKRFGHYEQPKIMNKNNAEKSAENAETPAIVHNKR